MMRTRASFHRHGARHEQRDELVQLGASHTRVYERGLAMLVHTWTAKTFLGRSMPTNTMVKTSPSEVS